MMMRLAKGGGGLFLYLRSEQRAGRIWYIYCNYSFHSSEGNIGIVKPLNNNSTISTALRYVPNKLTACEEVTVKQATSISLYAYEYRLKPEMKQMAYLPS